MNFAVRFKNLLIQILDKDIGSVHMHSIALAVCIGMVQPNEDFFSVTAGFVLSEFWIKRCDYFEAAYEQFR